MVSSDQSSHSVKYLKLSILIIPLDDCPNYSFVLLMTEMSCNFGWNCSWSTSTDASGNPDWVLSSVIALLPQEQQQVVEDSSSNRNLEGTSFPL
ncbi:hypothetical protein lerEdw1_017308 [Lerista edwardsae]|nr:hypothetical protein lerEdw1_017308 [Lerista edwardsae]